MYQRNLFSTLLPYCIQLQPCGRYAILNRNYKPVSWFTGEFIQYENYPVLAAVRITPGKAAKLSYNHSADNKDIYLYNDGCRPDRDFKAWLAYTERLKHLCEISRPMQNSSAEIATSVKNLIDAAGSQANKKAISHKVKSLLETSAY